MRRGQTRYLHGRCSHLCAAHGRKPVHRCERGSTVLTHGALWCAQHAPKKEDGQLRLDLTTPAAHTSLELAGVLLAKLRQVADSSAPSHAGGPLSPEERLAEVHRIALRGIEIAG